MPAIDMTKPSLRALAKALRGPMPKGFKWDFKHTHLLNKRGCGSRGCALGLALKLWPEQIARKDLYDGKLAKLFDLPEQTFHYIFWAPTAHDKPSYESVSARTVAKTINRFLKQGYL